MSDPLRQAIGFIFLLCPQNEEKVNIKYNQKHK